MKNSINEKSKLKDNHSYSALNMKIDSRDQKIFEIEDPMDHYINTNRIQNISLNTTPYNKDIEYYPVHTNTDVNRNYPKTNIDEEEKDNFILSIYKLKTNAISNEKTNSAYAKENQKQNCYSINQYQLADKKINSLKIQNLNDKSGNFIPNPNTLTNINNVNQSKPLDILNDSIPEIFQEGEIKIGIPVQIEVLETNRENNNDDENRIMYSYSTNENKEDNLNQTQFIPNDKENSLVLSCSNKNSNPIGNELDIQKGIRLPLKESVSVDTVNFSDEKIKKDNSNSTVQYCRICYEEESEQKGGLIYPCHCTGSCQFIHESCLKKWIENNFLDHKVKAECEICKHQYNMKFYVKWKFSKRKMCETIKSIVSLIFIASLILALVFSVIYVVVTALSELSDREKNNFIHILAGVGSGVMIILIIFSQRKCKKNLYEQSVCDWRIFNVDGCKIIYLIFIY